jgi:hypothetical protein
MTRRRNRRPSLHGFIEAVRSLIEAFRLSMTNRRGKARP